MDSFNETVLEINLTTLSKNYYYLKSHLGSNTKFLAVVKAFGYGSDAVQIAKHLESLNVNYFAVAYVNEGVQLRDAGITTPIMVLHPQPSNFKTLIDCCLEPSLYSPRVLQQFIDIASEMNQNEYPVHLKFNTGLNRLGFRENDIIFIHSHLNETAAIKVKSIFSHLASSEDLEEVAFSKSQIISFIKIAADFNASLENPAFLHMCNTSGVLNYPEAHFDMVRCGIGLYGFGNSAKENENLTPIASLKSVVSQIHIIQPNETVGYNRAFKATKSMKIATIPVGHADGIGRQYGNGSGFVIVNNKKAPILGNVCMDMIMVDITDIDCKEGSEVIFFNDTFTAEQLAESANTISYELITGISQRIKRKIIE